ncbi:MAG TPA: tetratricopeptide repeat protein, partial [Polyangiaceae bacterium]|nr:tetratricopeptide repeat protein [Polyangiaceae bacterium]
MSVAGSARADGNAADSERANLLFKKGKVAFNEGKYTDALRIYDEAWQLKQSPDIAANLAQTEAELGKHRDAAEHFAFALAHLLPSSTDEQKKALAEGLEIEKKDVGTLHVTLEPADAALNVDDAPVTLPTNGDIYVEPGDHHASVTRDGYQLNQQTVHVSKGGARVLWIRLEPADGATAAPTSSAETGTNLSAESPPESTNRPSIADSGGSSGRSLVPAFVGGGVAVVGAAAGIGFLLSGNSHANKADNLANGIPGQSGCGTGTLHSDDCAVLHDENQSGASARRLETVSFGVAGAAVVATVIYLLWPHAEGTSGRVSGPANLSALTP